MKKTIIMLFLGFILIFAATGCKKAEKNQNSATSGKKLSLVEWLKSGKGVSCSVQTPSGEVTVKAKGNKVRIEGINFAAANTGPGNLGASQAAGAWITNGDWAYIWSGSKGTKINLKEMQDLQKQADGKSEFNPDDYSWENWVVEQEKADEIYQCQEEKISEDIFKAPDNVEFMDLTKSMKEMNEMSKKFLEKTGASDQLPDIGGSSGMNKEEVEAQLEKALEASNTNIKK